MNAIEKIESLKKAMADKLGGNLNRLPVKTQKRYLILTGCIMASLCVAMVVAPFTQDQAHRARLPEGKIATAVIPLPEAPRLSPADLEMLRDFKHAMDSLKIHDVHAFQEILQGRHGLLDSVARLIQWHE
ncbi:hypothetical protein [Chryseolinea lacunae]|uniref:Uncharacterized protein n=1 Tax=Chryseolinea lacunae TaxID=2801331 RepID=A0ABS1KZH4_9BACT|nr:hypothetical protein [Chryseolinea lacunae]MBL0744866.1 hypothetical protein [Chryseolinea lacunae]